VRVVVGEQNGSASLAPHTVPCDVLGLGGGAEFVGEASERSMLAAPEGWPGTCTPGYLYAGAIHVASDWTYELREDSGGDVLWGGDFRVRRGECTGQVFIRVAPEAYDSALVTRGFVTVEFEPGSDPSCPEQCSSRHAATVEVIRGTGGTASGGAGSGGASGGSANDGSLSSGGADSSASGGGSVAAVGGVSASGGAATGGTGGGAPVLDAALDQRMQASCDAECADYAEVQGCYPQGASQEDCWNKCYSAVRTKYFALCPEEYLAVLDCTEEHPGAQEYTCDGTELVVADASCEILAATMRDCWSERQGS